MNAFMEVNYIYLLCGAELDDESGYDNNITTYSGLVLGDGVYNSWPYVYGVGIDYDMSPTADLGVKGAGVPIAGWIGRFYAD